METLSCIQQTTCKLLSSGQIPAHIGFIMDGNRRHAKKNKYQSTHQGHIEGVRSLKKCLLMCKHIGIKQISLFAFSVENFNRSEQEVEGLMGLCMKTFDQMSPMAEMLLKNGIKVRIVGRKDMLRQDVRNALEKIQTKTKDFKQIVVNLCFAYDSIHEVQTSISKMKSSSYSEFMNNLAMPNHLDILVRTANQYRLSNFMLPQAAYAYICILKQNWPQINLWSFCKIMLAYNYHYKDIMRNKKIIMDKMQLTHSKASQSTLQKILKQEPNYQSLNGENQQLIKEQ